MCTLNNIPSGHKSSKSSLNVFLAHHCLRLPSAFSYTVVCFTKATFPPPSTKHLKAPIYKEKKIYFNL